MANETLKGDDSLSGGGAAAQVLPARTGSPQLQDRMAGHWKRSKSSD